MALTRRELLGGAAGALGAGLLVSSCARRRPLNVVFVVMDDLNNWVGCLGGHPHTLTPNIDRLAARGVLFTRAYGDGVNCPASRSACLTGLAPVTTGIYGFQDLIRERAPEAATLPEYFAAHGYDVLGGGKIFHRLDDQPQWPEGYFFPDEPDLWEHRVGTEAWGLPGRETLNWGPLKIAESRMFDGRVARWAARQIERPRQRPFFLGIGFFRPHEPWFVPRRYLKPFRPRRVALPEVHRRDLYDVPRYARHRTKTVAFQTIRSHGQWRQAVAAYLASIHFADAQLGIVLDALDASPHRDDTAVVLWSDHGLLMGEKGAWTKFVLWEQATQVPLVVSAPSLFRPGRCAQPVTLVHLYPTLADLCRLPPNPAVDGRSLRPLLERPERTWETPAVVTMDCGSHALRTDRYRYIRYLDGSRELYDHESDPHEWHNLAEQPEQAELMAELDARLPKGCL